MDNIALKSIRFQGESPPGTPLDWKGVDLTHRDPYWVLTCRRGVGPAFEMVEPQRAWSWRKMLNRFDDDTLTRIIGPGVTGIFCQPMQVWDHHGCRSSYDHKREHWAKHGGVRFADVDGKPADVPVWDFVIHRGDGEWVRLHPNQTKKKVSISKIGGFDGTPIPTAADGPQAGRGLSDFRPHARGTFKRMLAKTHAEVVPAKNSVATASSADTRGDRAAPPVVTGLIGVGGRIGGVLGAAITTRGVLGAAMARGMPGAAMTLTVGGVPGTAMTTGGVPGTAMTTGGVPRQLANRDNQPAVAGLLGWAMVCQA